MSSKEPTRGFSQRTTSSLPILFGGPFARRALDAAERLVRPGPLALGELCLDECRARARSANPNEQMVPHSLEGEALLQRQIVLASQSVGCGELERLRLLALEGGVDLFGRRRSWVEGHQVLHPGAEGVRVNVD